MGTTFSTIQIQNHQKMEPAYFKQTLLKYIKKKGLIPTDKEKAQSVYSFIFSDNGSFVTLSSTEYEMSSETIDSDVRNLAEAFKTCCIKTSVYDSDSMFLYLFDAPSKQKDMVALGYLEDMSDSEYSVGTGKSECWSPLLIKGATWEQLTNIWQSDYVFIEEALTAMAPLLGMDSKMVATDYRYWSEIEPDSPRVVHLYFETASPLFITDGPTKLAFSMWSPVSIISGTESIVSFYNIGGISKGLTILIIGDCLKHGNVEITNIKVGRYKNSNDANSEFLVKDVHPKKEEFTDGRFGLSVNLDDFEFHEGVNIEHTLIKSFSEKGTNTLFTHSIVLNFMATIQSGSDHRLTFYAIPNSNWVDGQAGRTILINDNQSIENLFEGI